MGGTVKIEEYLKDVTDPNKVKDRLVRTGIERRKRQSTGKENKSLNPKKSKKEDDWDDDDDDLDDDK